MSVSTTANKVIFPGDGSSTTFAFANMVGSPLTKAAFQLELTTAAGVVTILPSNAWTLVLTAAVAPNLWGIGGSVTYPIGASPTAIPAGSTLTLLRTVALTQGTSFATQGANLPSAIEAAVDNLTLITQQLFEQVSRAIQAPEVDGVALSELPVKALRASLFAGFDSNGNPIATPGPLGSSAAVSAFVNTLLGSGSASAFLTLLGVSTFVKTLLPASTSQVFKAGIGLGGLYSIVDYGAVGDGTTDDTAAINAAVTAASAQGSSLGKSAVLIPAPPGGVGYKVTSTITVNVSSQCAGIFGFGMVSLLKPAAGITCLKLTGDTSSANAIWRLQNFAIEFPSGNAGNIGLLIDNGSTGIHGVMMDGLNVIGDPSNVSLLGTGIKLNFGLSCTFQSCVIGSFSLGVDLNGPDAGHQSNACRFFGCNFQGNGTDDIRFTNASTGFVYGCTMQGSKVCVNVGGPTNAISVIGCHMEPTIAGMQGITVTGGTLISIGNSYFGSTGTGIVASGTAKVLTLDDQGTFTQSTTSANELWRWVSAAGATVVRTIQHT